MHTKCCFLLKVQELSKDVQILFSLTIQEYADVAVFTKLSRYVSRGFTNISRLIPGLCVRMQCTDVAVFTKVNISCLNSRNLGGDVQMLLFSLLKLTYLV
jgi:hypothetical protein